MAVALLFLVVLLVVFLDVDVVSRCSPPYLSILVVLLEVAASFLLQWGLQWNCVLGANGRLGENCRALDSSQGEYGSTFVYTLSKFTRKITLTLLYF
jgi:hypothetical protein